MDLLAYFRVLRRRWLLILILVIVGAGLGAATTELKGAAPKERTYYKATHTLQLDTAATSSSVTPTYNNVEQVSILVTTGGVPDAVAKTLGTDKSGRELAEQIVTLTAGVPSTIDITATDPDAQRATELADAFGDELIKQLDERVVAKYNKARDLLSQQLGQLRAQSDAYLAQLRAIPPPADFDIIKVQYDATQNEYYSTYGQVQAFTSGGVPSSGLSTLQTAQAVPISKTEYESRLSLGAAGQNHLRAENSQTGVSPITVTTAGGSTLDDPLSRGILGGFLGLLAGIGLALVLDRLDHRIRTRAEAELAFQLPVLADVPEFSRSQQRNNEVVAFSAPLSRSAEAYRAVRTSLLFQQQSVMSGDRSGAGIANGASLVGNGDGSRTRPDEHEIFEPTQQDPLVVMVTSAAPREGKTNTSANLAAAFAESGAQVLIVNCDFRRPNVHRLLGVTDEPRKVCSTPIPGVKIVTNVLSDTAANPSKVAAAQRQVIAAARERFDVVILDTAPILTANDAIEIVSSADFVLLVARAGLTTTDKAERTMEVLTRLEAPMAGVVLAASTDASNDYYYYYQRGRVPSPRKAKRGKASKVAEGDAPLLSEPRTFEGE